MNEVVIWREEGKSLFPSSSSFFPYSILLTHSFTWKSEKEKREELKGN